MSADYIPAISSFETNDETVETERHPEFQATVLERGKFNDQVRLADMIAANNDVIEQVTGNITRAFQTLDPANRAQVLAGLPPHWLNDRANYPLYAHLVQS